MSGELMSPAVGEATRYEQIMAAHSVRPGDLAARFALAGRAARAAVEVRSEREAAIRDVAAGVAAPALVGFVIWMQEQSRLRGLRRLRFLSRDGQVLYELTRRLAPVFGGGLDLEYVYSSRLTWSLADTQPDRLAEAPWLFNSFIKSNAADVCARLGLSLARYRPTMLACGVSLEPDVRADEPRQAGALFRFVGMPEVARAVGTRIEAIRRLVLNYAAQHHLAEADTGLVDIGWTGRMVASLIHVCEAAGMNRPHILFWGHEPRAATGWTDPERVSAYVYNTATGEGLGWRVPDAPLVMETFCMGDHGIVSGYRARAAGHVEPVLLSPRNDAAEAWGLRLYRSTLYEFCAALDFDRGLPGDDVRPLVHQVMDAFWFHPTRAEAVAWGAYPYDSDAAGTAIRPLARPFTDQDCAGRGDREWLAGSLALSAPEVRAVYLRRAPERELAGAPETDLRRINGWRLWLCLFDSPLRSVDSDGSYIRVLLAGGGLEFDHQLGGHSAAVFYLDALSLGPLADLGGVQAARRSPAPGSRWPTSTAADPPRSAHIARDRVSQSLCVLLVQVDLILRTVQPESDGTFGGTAVKVGLTRFSPVKPQR